MKHKGNLMHGWLALDKPAGMTSTQALGKVRRILGAAKAGHGGTLDPLATGILPLAFGEATKTVAYVMDASKKYRFTIKWGAQTSTDDSEGQVLHSSANRSSRAAIEAALPGFIGYISQIPPAVSAIKVDGARAYDLVRAGEQVELAARHVRIDAITLISMDDSEHTTLEMACGKGTYVRSLARDLAVKLGTFGHVSALRRLKVGRFTEENAISLDSLEQNVQNTDPSGLLLPVETALDDIPALALTDEQAQRLRCGQTVSLLSYDGRQQLLALPEAARAGAPVLALCGGKALALAEIAAGELRVVRLFNL
jgi:tRNA pseudouridine55 synthase